MLKQNDIVSIDNEELTITSIWNQGRHKVFCMSNDKLILDLDKAVESGNIKLVISKKEIRPQREKTEEEESTNGWLDK